MNILIIGSGRMGIRHCLGAMTVKQVKKIFVADINESALNNAKQQLNKKDRSEIITFYLLEDFLKLDQHTETVIISSTAGNRLDSCKIILQIKPRYVLIEKPLGQSIEQVKNLIDFFEINSHIKAFVNLNTRLYPGYNKLKKDLELLKQFNGRKTISINTGTVGIGANGIHYIDLIKYLLGAFTLELIAGEIDENIIPSGRGSEFCDYGGWAIVDYKDKDNKVLGRVHFILGSQSTVFAPWEIVGQHGRIQIDEFEQTRSDKIRKHESELPIQRYAGDYLPISKEEFTVPMLNDLTYLWLTELINGNFVLPELKESFEAHSLLFDWLALSKTHKGIYPIT
jgi:predicted dehydrogenase